MERPDPNVCCDLLKNLALLAATCAEITCPDKPGRALEELAKRINDSFRRVRGNRGHIPIEWADLQLILEGSLKGFLSFMAERGESSDA